MKLSVTRSQTHRGTDRKGRSEGVVFNLGCKLYLDQDDSQAIEHYRLSEYVMVHLPLTEIRELNERDTLWSPERLQEGWTFNTRYASDALHAEALMKQGCSDFRKVIDMLESYGGEEVVEF